MCVCAGLFCVTDRAPAVYQPPADQLLLLPTVQLKFLTRVIHLPSTYHWNTSICKYTQGFD